MSTCEYMHLHQTVVKGVKSGAAVRPVQHNDAMGTANPARGCEFA